MNGQINEWLIIKLVVKKNTIWSNHRKALLIAKGEVCTLFCIHINAILRLQNSFWSL